MAYKTTASLDELTCADYMCFGKCQEMFGPFYCSKNDSKYLAIKLKMFTRDDRGLRLVQNLTMGETDFNRFIRLRKQLLIAAENFVREENLSAVLIQTMSKDMDEQLKLAHKMIDVMDQANRKFCVTFLRYNVEKPESSYAQVWIFVKKKKEEKLVQVTYELADFIYLLDVMDSVYDKLLTNQLIYDVLWKVNSSVYPFIIFFYSSQYELQQLEIRKTFFSS